MIDEFNSYITTSDAIGFCFQISDHAFYCITFPEANKTWLYDLKSKTWCEWNYYNSVTGSLNRHRANCCMNVYNKIMIGDWENGKIYYLDSNLFTDNGNPILRIKTFAHLVENYDRVTYKSFDADMQVATDAPGIVPEPMVSLSWSDDRGVTYGFPVDQSLGAGGEYLTTVSWNRLGMARDRIFKLQWSADLKTALNGGFIEMQKART